MPQLIKMDYFDSLRTGKSAAVDSWPLMSSPFILVAILTAYFAFIYRLGPQLMKKRAALELNKTLKLYNVVQVGLSAFICFKCINLQLFKDGLLSAGCSYPGTTQNSLLLECGWWYFFAKVTELLDTVFFVLRKKFNQVSFLHVYHHVVMAIYSWSYLKYAAGGEGAVLAFLNSMVHVVMYSYYLLAAMPGMKKYLWWKKYVTFLQLAQFVYMLIYCMSTYNDPNCQFPRGFTYFIAANIFLFFILFINFFVKNYRGKSTQKLDEICLFINENSKEQINKKNDKLANGNTSKGKVKLNEDEKSSKDCEDCEQAKNYFVRSVSMKCVKDVCASTQCLEDKKIKAQ